MQPVTPALHNRETEAIDGPFFTEGVCTATHERGNALSGQSQKETTLTNGSGHDVDLSFREERETRNRAEAPLRSRSFLAGPGLVENCEHLAIVMLEGPL